jgi:hypothetical protein
MHAWLFAVKIAALFVLAPYLPSPDGSLRNQDRIVEARLSL